MICFTALNADPIWHLGWSCVKCWYIVDPVK